MRLIAFCEAKADFEILHCLLRKVAAAHGPGWVREMVDVHADDLFGWVAPGVVGETFFRWRDLVAHMNTAGIRRVQGAFGGRRGGPDAMSGLNALLVVRAHAKESGPLDAAVLLRDADDQPERIEGLRLAREHHAVRMTGTVAIGVANPKREAWVLAGFEPKDDAERERLESATRDLGFDPSTDAHRLVAKTKGAKTNAKDVLASLVGVEVHRERECYEDAPLERLQARGTESGLVDFLIELRERVVPKA